MDTTAKPRGRRPGRADTRQAILRAALDLFSEFGYDKVSLRSVARAADVDPALIHHYFENKADLFSRAVLDLDFNADRLLRTILDGPTEQIGERAATCFVTAWEAPGVRERFTAVFRAAVNAEAPRRPLAEFVCKEIFTKVAQHLGHRDASVRANFAVTALLGLTMGRDIIELPLLAAMKQADLIKGLGKTLQLHLAEP